MLKLRSSQGLALLLLVPNLDRHLQTVQVINYLVIIRYDPRLIDYS